MSNLAVLKWRPFEYRAKLEKRPLLFRSEKGIFDMFFKRLCEKICEDLQINSENFKPVPLCSIKWHHFKVFVKLYNSPLSIVNTVKVTVSGLTKCLAAESP